MKNFQVDAIKSEDKFDCSYSIIIKRKSIPISARTKRILVSNSHQDNPGFSNNSSFFEGNETEILKQFESRFLEQSQNSLASKVSNLTSDFGIFMTGSRALEVIPSNVLKVSNTRIDFDNDLNDGSSGTLSTGALVGAIVGGLLFLGILITIIVVCIIKKKKQGKKGKKKAQTRVKVLAKHIEANSPASQNNPQHASPKHENFPVQSPLSRNTNFTEHSHQTPGNLPMTPNGRFSHYPMYYGHPGLPQGQGQGQGQYDPSGMGLPPNSVSSNNRGSLYPNTPSPYMGGGFNPHSPHNPSGNSLNMNMPGINQIPQDFAPEKAQGHESELRMYEINVGDVPTYGQKK